MTQAPAVVAQSFKPTGQRQLHLLAEDARFHCVRCRQDRSGIFVATIGGDWTQTLCRGCHQYLVRAERQTAKKQAAKATPRPPQARHQPGKTGSGTPEGTSPSPMSEKRLQQLRRGLPGVDRLLQFFRAADLEAEFVRGGCLWLDGNQTQPLTRRLMSRESIDWNSVIDQIAVRYAGEVFIRAVADNAYFGEGLRAFLRRHESGFAIMRDDARLATIFATHARIKHGESIYANFLTPGAHWQKIADAIHRAEADQPAGQDREQAASKVAGAASARAASRPTRRPAQKRIDNLPDDLPPELTRACLEASRRIRQDRQVAYERPVVLECSLGNLTLLPVTGTSTLLHLPFRLTTATQTLTGELILTEHDPLPIQIGGEVPDRGRHHSLDLRTPWLCRRNMHCARARPSDPPARACTATAFRLGTSAQSSATSPAAEAALAPAPRTRRQLGPLRRLARRRPPTPPEGQPDSQPRGPRTCTSGRNHSPPERDMGQATHPRHPRRYRDALPMAGPNRTHMLLLALQRETFHQLKAPLSVFGQRR
jgi:hypothetical protein